MTQIVLSPDQSNLIRTSPGPVVIVDAQGKQLAILTRATMLWTPEEIAEMERWAASGEPGIPHAQVMARLRW